MFLKKDGQEEQNPGRRMIDNEQNDVTLIAPAAKITGEVSGRDSLRVAGHFEGDIKIEGIVIIEDRGQITGTVAARGIVVSGEINGDIEASEKIEIRPEGKVMGNVTCAKIALAEGCFFQGEIKMPEGTAKPHTFQEKRATKEAEDNEEE